MWSSQIKSAQSSPVQSKSAQVKILVDQARTYLKERKRGLDDSDVYMAYLLMLECGSYVGITKPYLRNTQVFMFNARREGYSPEGTIPNLFHITSASGDRRKIARYYEDLAQKIIDKYPFGRPTASAPESLKHLGRVTS